MKLTLRIWRQSSADQPGTHQSYLLENVSPDLSLLEALDQLNEQLISSGERPVSFEQGEVGGDVFQQIALMCPGLIGAALAPDAQGEFHL